MTTYKKIILNTDKDEFVLILTCVWNTIKAFEKSPYPYSKITLKKLRRTEKKLSKIYLELLNN